MFILSQEIDYGFVKHHILDFLNQKLFMGDWHACDTMQNMIPYEKLHLFPIFVVANRLQTHTKFAIYYASSKHPPSYINQV